MKPNSQLLLLLDSARLDVVLGAIASCWLMVFLAFAIEPANLRNAHLNQFGLPVSLLITALVAVGLTAGAIVLNNLLDTRYDRRNRLRPPTEKTISINTHLIICAALFLISVAAAGTLGIAAGIGAVIIATGIIFYNIAGRFIPSASVITLAVIYGLIMIVPNWKLAFTWPIVLAVTHVMVCATIRLTMAGSKRKLHHLDLIWILLAWLFLMLLLISLMHSRHVYSSISAQQINWAWLGPFIAVIVFTIYVAGSLKKHRLNNSANAQHFVTTANIWIIIYAASWLFSIQLFWQAGVICALLIIAIASRMILANLKKASVSPSSYYLLDIDRPVKL